MVWFFHGFPMFSTSILVYSRGDQATPPRLPSLNFKDFPLSMSPETVAYYAYDLPEQCSAATVEQDLSSAAVCVPAASCGNSGVVVPGRPESLCLFFLHGFGPEESWFIWGKSSPPCLAQQFRLVKYDDLPIYPEKWGAKRLTIKQIWCFFFHCPGIWTYGVEHHIYMGG